MPPKSLLTSSTGQENESTTDYRPEYAKTIVRFNQPIALDALKQGMSDPDQKRLAPQAQSAALATPTVMLDPRRPKLTKGNGYTLQIRQLWEGTVTRLHSDGFEARLSDKTNPNNPDEQALFDFEYVEVSDDDQRLLRPGSVFYWTVGTERTPAGQVKNVSNVEFRYYPAWTQGAIASASTRAASLKEWLEQSERIKPAEI
ncbi:MAG TPA: hypothetical protein VMB18_01110 [Terriglobales bacterium]|nr:hypothetical protein [Terriglobales bacterium]